jgi:hypothetical protein
MKDFSETRHHTDYEVAPIIEKAMDFMRRGGEMNTAKAQ